jgi:hypothetical protein
MKHIIRWNNYKNEEVDVRVINNYVGAMPTFHILYSRSTLMHEGGAFLTGILK